MSNASPRLRRDVLIAIGAGVLGFAADYGKNVVLSRVLETHEFGDYRVGRAFAVFCGALVLLGGDRAAPRVLAKPLTESRLGVVWEYLRFYGLIGLGVSGVLIAAVLAGGYLHHGTWDPNAHHAVAILALTIPFMAAGALSGRTLQSVGKTFYAAMPWRVGAPVLLLGVLLADRLVTGAVGLNDALWLSVLSVVVVALVHGALARRHALGAVSFAPDAREPVTWLTLSVPMMGVFLVTKGLGDSDLYFLEWLGDEAAVGHYAAAITTAHVLLLIQTAIVALYAPLLGRQVTVDDDRASPALYQGARIMALVQVPVVLGLALTAAPILGVFGPTYPDAAPVLRLLAVGNGAWALAALSALWLQYHGRGTTVMGVALATLVVDSLLNLLLIPHFGPVGAAASSAATSIVAAAAIGWIAHRLRTAG